MLRSRRRPGACQAPTARAAGIVWTSFAVAAAANPSDASAQWTPTVVRAESDAWTRSVSCWVQTCVIGLELCPWAAAAAAGGMRVVVERGDEGDVLTCVARELRTLADTAGVTERATTLVASPGAFESFASFLDGAAAVEDMIDARDLTGVIQLATFHPTFRFAETEEHDASNWTNRSPCPVFHLLREADVTRALRAGRVDAEQIWSANVARTRALGSAHMRGLLGGCAPRKVRA
ncbi:hypothetical protein KFE25_006344 [Diacronema lutheri]|uniref:DUF1415 domain-containing protein n=1 Tax=Diacronema lutheri TaxID=2081491 RepID=A0A8J5XSV5_DIALT|nr:hypothetical protein KFE25_006344 [Diacronema lutheri]